MVKRQSKSQSPKKKVTAETYRHPESTNVLRPEIGIQNRFRKKKPPQTYQYDSSLSPALDWDGQNPAREQGEALIQKILEAESLEEAKSVATELKAMSRAFLNWSGKAERLSFDVPSLPLFIHERLSTKAIIETLQSHRKKPGQTQLDIFEHFGDPQHSIADQILRAYQFQDKWVNRMILGDSLAVMNSLLRYESLGGQVQMIYMDPPYGVKFGSNFQPFIRKRDVKHNDDKDMTREPETVKAYRDTWELGLHSYLSYMRDRLFLAKDLLHPSGSVFVQISDENVHHVRELMDEVFGKDNFCLLITYQKTGGIPGKLISPTIDYIIWYAKDKNRIKFNQLFLPRERGDKSFDRYDQIEFKDGSERRLTTDELFGITPVPEGKRFQLTSLFSEGAGQKEQPFEFNGITYYPASGKHWTTTIEGLKNLALKSRIKVMGSVLRYKRYIEDFPVTLITDRWDSVQLGTERTYVVQTSLLAIQRCILMTTDPGDLVLDPTCGSGTTAYVAEQWGRRWITIDTSRVPLALARQRLLTAIFPWYELKEEKRGPAGGFVYKRKQNRKGEEVGGIVPHITLKSIANNEPPKEEILADRPETDNKIVRVCGPFVFESTIPAPADWEDQGSEESEADPREGHAAYIARMIEVLRHSPVLHIDGGKTVSLKQVRPPAKTLSLSAEAILSGGEELPVAILFGPENGAISEVLVSAAHDEASMKSRGYAHLYVIGFAIQPNARQYIEHAAQIGIPATYIQATPDLLMGDLLKNMRSSQIFSVCGLPEIEIISLKDGQYQVRLLGLDVFDPATMENEHRRGDDVPAWFLDTDYNGTCFHVCQAFFPRTGAWEHLKKALKSTHEESVWDHLAGSLSTPFELGEHRQIAVKVIDDRGNELMVVRKPDSGVQKKT